MVNIPSAVRQQVWIQRFGKIFEHKCHISWCTNQINVYNFHCGHDTPASKGGDATIVNLFPICANCNLGMGDKYTIREWDASQKKLQSRKFCMCFH